MDQEVPGSTPGASTNKSITCGASLPRNPLRNPSNAASFDNQLATKRASRTPGDNQQIIVTTTDEFVRPSRFLAESARHAGDGSLHGANAVVLTVADINDPLDVHENTVGARQAALQGVAVRTIVPATVSGNRRDDAAL